MGDAEYGGVRVEVLGEQPVEEREEAVPDVIQRFAAFDAGVGAVVDRPRIDGGLP